MTTLRDVLEDAERRSFVGRQAERARFASWLDDDDIPSVLNVVGLGGVGKTALVRTFERHARDVGRAVTSVDAAILTSDPEALLRALGGDEATAAPDWLNATKSLVIIDTFEQIVSLRPFLLDELLPALSPAVRVVIAGRQPLLVGTARAGPWRHAVEELPLDVLDDEHVHDYLQRRGLSGHPQAPEIAHVSRGHPLAMCLAADVVSGGAEHLAAAPNWQLAVRAIAEQLLRDVADPTLRSALEAASIVRRFDEDLIRFMTREQFSAREFRGLAELALVRPRRIGLSVHEDVRRVINADVRWRAPHRHRELRTRALAHYRRQARRTAGTERQLLLDDAFLLMEDTVVEAMIFGNGHEPGAVQLEEALGPDDLDDLRAIEQQWWDEVLPSFTPHAARSPGDRDNHLETIELLSNAPEARLRLARCPDGDAIGYSLVLPVDERTAPLLEAHGFPIHAEAGLIDPGPAAGPTPTPAGEVFQIVQIAYVGRRAAAANAALWRDLVELFARGGAYLMTAMTTAQAQLLGELGFVPLAATGPSDGTPMMLDLRARQLEEWIRSDVLPAAAPPRLDEPGSSTDLDAHRRAGVSIRVLDGFAVTRNGVDVTPPGVGGQLVRTLAVSGGELHLDVLAEHLWPDTDPSTSRTRFRNVLSRLRTAAGDLVERRGERIRLAPDTVVDVAVFEELARRALTSIRGGDPSGASEGLRAIAMISGPVLPTDPYADWAAGPRERIERQLVALLDVLADAVAQDGGHDEAVQLYQRAIDVQPFDESRYLRLARTHVAAGRTGPALAAVERAMGMLAELDLRPSERLQSFVDELRTSHPTDG